jgi:hypothetical protein
MQISNERVFKTCTTSKIMVLWVTALYISGERISSNFWVAVEAEQDAGGLSLS